MLFKFLSIRQQSAGITQHRLRAASTAIQSRFRLHRGVGSGQFVECFPATLAARLVSETAMNLEHITAHIALRVESLDPRFRRANGVGQGAQIQTQPMSQAIVLFQLQVGIEVSIDAGDASFQILERGRARASKFLYRKQVLLKLGIEAVLQILLQAGRLWSAIAACQQAKRNQQKIMEATTCY